MTTPKVGTIKRGDARFYVNPETKKKAPGVTSIVDMLPKAFLKRWAAKHVAEFAVEHLGEVVGLALKDPDAAVDLLKRSPDRDTQKAADVGTEVHDIFERLIQGEKVGRLHPEFQVYADYFREFLDDYQPELLALETTVWSDTHNYAGSFDFLGRIKGETVIGDWKTTRSGVHEEVGLQLSAYRFADYILHPDGTKEALPEIDGGFVLHVRPEGWSLHPIRCDRVTFEYFLALRKTFEWVTELSETVIGAPLNENHNPGSTRKKGRARSAK